MSLPLDLFAEVTTASGTRYRWDANAAPGDRPRGASFRTKVGEGFSDASLNLARRVDLDYPDLNLVDSIALVGADGSVAYEGRIEATPRELSDSHSIGVQLAGWMAHTKDRKFTEVYVDRDPGAWGDLSRGRRAGLLAVNNTPVGPTQMNDLADQGAGIKTQVEGAWASPFLPVAEAWYDAGPGLTIGRISYTWTRAGIDGSALWFWRLFASSDDKLTASLNSGNLVSTAATGSGIYVPTTAYRYAMLQAFYNATPAGADGAQYGIDWTKLAVYGSHYLNLYTGETGEPLGVTASDVIKDVAERFCPALNTTGVQDTSYVIQHLTFKEQTFPYDAFLQVNKYHQWHLGVWENRTLTFAPYDMSDYDWQVRTDDPGTTFRFEGPTTEALCNGINVIYVDLNSGVKNVLTPDVYSDLADTDPSNPWNEHGIPKYIDIELSTPTLLTQARDVGRIALAEAIRPKRPSSITVRGYIKDRAGNPQPVWKVRAGDTIAVTSYPGDAPRLLQEVSYDHESYTATLSADAPASSLDAIMERVGTALQARGLNG